MKNITILLFLLLGMMFVFFQAVDDTINSEEIYVHEEPIQVPTIKESFNIENFSIKPLYDYEISGVILKIKKEKNRKESNLSQYDIVLGWKELSKPENYKNIDLTLRYKYFSWKNNSSISDGIVNKNISNNHIIPSDSMIIRQLSELKEGQIVSFKGNLVRATDIYDRSWGWRSSSSRTDKGDGSSELFYVNYIEVIK